MKNTLIAIGFAAMILGALMAYGALWILGDFVGGIGWFMVALCGYILAVIDYDNEEENEEEYWEEA